MFMALIMGNFLAFISGIAGLFTAQKALAPLLGPFADLIQNFFNSLG